MAETRTKVPKRGKRTPTLVREAAELYATLGLQPAEVLALLEQHTEPNALPSLRTVQSIVAEVRQNLDREWDWEEMDPADVALVLPVYRAVVEYVHAPVTFTQGLAERIARIRRIAPDLGPNEHVWRLASFPSDRLRDYLAWREWTSADAKAEYQDAVNEGIAR